MNKTSLIAIALIMVFAIAACDNNKGQIASAKLTALSTKATMVSGGNVLIGLETNMPLEDLQFSLNGNVVTLVFADTDRSGIPTSLLSGLIAGENIIAVLANNNVLDKLTVINHPITGPIFSGAQQQPYLCLSELAPTRNGEARQFAIGNGDNLDLKNADENCHLPTRKDFVYMSVDTDKKGFQPLINVNDIPADVHKVELGGKEIPFIVQLETGTINRAVYQIATLYDPSANDPTYAWNQRLIYTFGGGCEAGFHQGTSTGGVLHETLLAQGYAIASSTLNVNRQGGCNDVISAETAMMVKEHFIETVGIPAHTIGLGSSGGAMQQHLIANAYPGILNGLIVGASFPDPITYFMDSADCALPLRNYLNNQDISDETKAAIGGWQQWSTCDVSLGLRPARISPYDCASEIPEHLAYHEVNNPHGIRCSIYDGMKNIFGQIDHPRVEGLSVAPSPHDNAGVQYGLRALQAGLISKTLFLDLNEKVGGWDIDYQPTKERVKANPRALDIAYKSGRIANGKSLANIPIIDDRAYLDAIGNFHTSVYSFALRARLIRDNGHADNHVIRRHPREQNITEENVRLMDEWLTQLEEPISIKGIRRAKPSTLADDCFTETGERIVEPAVFTEEDLFQPPKGQCNQLYPVHGNPRMVAGGPLAGDIMKCQLKPINWRDYGVEFSEAEKARLHNIFPEGVCDWQKPGVAQAANETWQSF